MKETDWAALLTDIARIRQHAPHFTGALEAYFVGLLRRETSFIDRPSAGIAARAKTDREVMYALGLREGLLRGRLILDALEQMARRAIEQEQQNATPVAVSPDASYSQPAGVPAAAPAGTASGRPAGRAATPGIAGLPDWVSTVGGAGPR